MARLTICFSQGIRAIKGIERFLAVDAVISPSDEWTHADDVTVAVWGRKKNTRRAVNYAKRHDLPILYLEDGFLRSCSEDPHSRLTYSLVVDRKGVYYDSSSGSELESLLNANVDVFDEAFDTIEIELSQACLEIVVEYNVTKYNYCQDYQAPENADDRPVVLVIDQTEGDASVTCGGMDKSAFSAMLRAALDENPDSRIVVKTHPDVVAGLRKGYLTESAASLGIEVISDIVNPISLLKTVDHVYVGTSQLGMEALLCGKPVTVFGKPFYAGWGLTDDRADLSHRTATRSVLELFFAAYMWYPRYCNPVTGEIWTLPECLQHVLLQKGHFARNARDFCCIGVTPWKRRYVSQYLRSPDGSVSYVNQRQLKRQIDHGKCDVVATWGYRMSTLASMVASRAAPIEIARIEDGFIRSNGLGSDFNAPASLVIDRVGMYFNPKNPSELQHLLNTADCTLDDTLRARRLINLILSAKLSKYNLSGQKSVKWPMNHERQTLLVVGQVETDASIRYGCHSVRTNADLLIAVRRSNPDAWIVYKPHPDVVAGNRPGKVPAMVLEQTINTLELDADIVSCLEAADELHTMTSLSGFEALLRRKTVVTYGAPFYAGWGLTTDKVQHPSRTRERTLEELVYFSLVRYPVYMDIETGEFASPEDIVSKIRSGHMKNNKTLNWSGRQVIKLVNVCKGLSYAP